MRPPRPDRARRLHLGCRGLQAGDEPLPPAQAARQPPEGARRDASPVAAR